MSANYRLCQIDINKIYRQDQICTFKLFVTFKLLFLSICRHKSHKTVDESTIHLINYFYE